MSIHQITPKNNEMTSHILLTNISDKELCICQDKLGYPALTTMKSSLKTKIYFWYHRLTRSVAYYNYSGCQACHSHIELQRGQRVKFYYVPRNKEKQDMRRALVTDW